MEHQWPHPFQRDLFTDGTVSSASQMPLNSGPQESTEDAESDGLHVFSLHQRPVHQLRHLRLLQGHSLLRHVQNGLQLDLEPRSE